MAGSAQDIMTFPYWATNKTQDTARIPGARLRHALEDIDLNREPLRTDYSHTYINVLMRPRIQQDTSQMTNLSHLPSYGVTNPGGLYGALLDSVPSIETGFTARKAGSNGA